MGGGGFMLVSGVLQGAPSSSIPAATEVQHCILFLSVRQLALLTFSAGKKRRKKMFCVLYKTNKGISQDVRVDL